MNVLERILEEIDGKIKFAGRMMVEKPCDKLDEIANDTAEAFINAYEECCEVIRSHIDEVPDTESENTTDWQEEARRKCAAAGELRIAIGMRLEEIRTRILGNKRFLTMEENSIDQVILQWKIRQLQEEEAWLESILHKRHSERKDDGGNEKTPTDDSEEIPEAAGSNSNGQADS